jgi:hypothetical protein
VRQMQNRKKFNAKDEYEGVMTFLVSSVLLVGDFVISGKRQYFCRLSDGFEVYLSEKEYESLKKVW